MHTPIHDQPSFCYVLTMLLATSLLTGSALADTISYVPASGGDWNVPANWDLGHCPQTNDAGANHRGRVGTQGRVLRLVRGSATSTASRWTARPPRTAPSGSSITSSGPTTCTLATTARERIGWRVRPFSGSTTFFTSATTIPAMVVSIWLAPVPVAASTSEACATSATRALATRPHARRRGDLPPVHRPKRRWHVLAPRRRHRQRAHADQSVRRRQRRRRYL